MLKKKRHDETGARLLSNKLRVIDYRPLLHNRMSTLYIILKVVLRKLASIRWMLLRKLLCATLSSLIACRNGKWELFYGSCTCWSKGKMHRLLFKIQTLLEFAPYFCIVLHSYLSRLWKSCLCRVSVKLKRNTSCPEMYRKRQLLF